MGQVGRADLGRSGLLGGERDLVDHRPGMMVLAQGVGLALPARGGDLLEERGGQREGPPLLEPQAGNRRRTHAWAVRGRASSRQQAVSLVEDGVDHRSDSPLNGRIFLRFVKRRLAPWLKPGDIVVLDNLNFHKMVAVRRAIEAAGAFIYLPTYSPEPNPIEPLWADLKRDLRRMGLDTVEMLRWALRRLRAALPLHRIDGWFRGALAEAQIK